jgi:hypothetical protein
MSTETCPSFSHPLLRNERFTVPPVAISVTDRAFV